MGAVDCFSKYNQYAARGEHARWTAAFAGHARGVFGCQSMR